jgi:uracil-DNA glycosylase
MELEEIKQKMFNKLEPSGWGRVFKSFIFIGQDPYPQLGVADGVSFSCSNTGKAQPSIRFILEEVNRTVYNGHPVSEDVDLSRWSNQGILMLNTALTVEVDKIGSHYDIWRKFTAYLLDWLSNYNPGLIYVYMGKKAEEWSELTTNTEYKFMVKHPASAAYNGSKWDSDNVFNKISSIVTNTTGNIITW